MATHEGLRLDFHRDLAEMAAVLRSRGAAWVAGQPFGVDRGQLLT